MAKVTYLYDPRTNITEKVTLDYLQSLTGLKKATLMSYRSKKARIHSLNSYLTMNKPDLSLRKRWYSKERYKGEKWLIIEGSGNKFKISNYGRVKRIYKTKENFMMPFRRSGKGRLFVKCQFLNKYTDQSITQLVAHHFIRPRRKNEKTYHKNGIVTDDYVMNLEYVTNQEFGRRTGHLSRSKPVLELCVETNQIISEYRSAREAGRKNFMSYQTVLDNCNRVTSFAVGDRLFIFQEDYEGMLSHDFKNR